MATRPPASDPNQRLPWIILGVVVLLVVIGLLAYFASQRSGVTLSIEGTPSAVARGTVGPPPTLSAPTLPPSQPTTTPPPAPTPVPTKPAAPTAVPTLVPPKPVAEASPAAGAPAATAPPAAAPAPAAPQPTQPAQPTPTPFAGQVSNPGGMGNTRADLQTAYGNPTGETPDHLVVFRKDNLEYHVGLAPDLNGRAILVVELPGQGAQPWTPEAAMAEARQLLPKDVQPPSPAAEGGDQFIVQRFTSQSLAQALGDEPFTAVQAQPGQLLGVYARDPNQGGRITRIVVGIGNDPGALLNRGR